MFLIICENLWGSSGGDPGGVDSTINDRLNKVIVGVKKGSNATCNEPLPKADYQICPTLMPPHHQANL